MEEKKNGKLKEFLISFLLGFLVGLIIAVIKRFVL